MLPILQIEVLRWNRLCKYHNQNLYDKNLYIFPSHQLPESHQETDMFFPGRFSGIQRFFSKGF